MKILSTVPSLTELLFDLGLENQMVGRTKFCVHPKEKVQKIPIIGGTKSLKLDKIKELKPDLIIANKEENVKEQIEELQKEFEVLVTDISTLEENNSAILQIGKLTKTENEAEKLNDEINAEFSKLNFTKPFPKAAYLIWKNPYMTVGGDTFISEMLHRAGFENLFENQIRYPKIELNQLKNADFIFLSSEPFPFKQKHIDEIQHVIPNAKCLLVDGEMFSWYGSRMRFAPNYFLHLHRQIGH